MIKAALKRWLYRAFLLLTIAAALFVSHYSAWNQSLPSVFTSVAVLMLIVGCTIYAWNGDKEDEDVAQPINHAPTEMIPMPTVELTPTADRAEVWLREQQREEKR